MIHPDNAADGGLKALTTLHKRFATLQVLFVAAAFFLVYNDIVKATNSIKQLQVVAVLLALGGFFASSIFFKNGLKKIRAMNNTLPEKFQAYRKICIFQWAFINGPFIFSIIGFLLSSNYAFFFLAGSQIIIFIALAPSKTKLVYHLLITKEQAEEL